jgi:hypothetical protein
MTALRAYARSKRHFAREAAIDGSLALPAELWLVERNVLLEEAVRAQRSGALSDRCETAKRMRLT